MGHFWFEGAYGSVAICTRNIANETVILFVLNDPQEAAEICERLNASVANLLYGEAEG